VNSTFGSGLAGAEYFDTPPQPTPTGFASNRN
jgi:hypothetical protein